MTPWAWLILPFLVAGFDATRSLTPALGVGAVVVVLTLPLARHGAADAVRPQPSLPPPSTWLVIAVGLLVSVLLLVLVGAPTTSAVLGIGAVGVAALVVALGFLRRRRAGPESDDQHPPVPRRTARPSTKRGLELVDALALPALLGGVAALAGAVLPPAASAGNLPWSWILAWAAWLVGTAAIRHARGRDVALGRAAVLAYGIAAGLAASQGVLGVLVAIALLLDVAVAAMLFGRRAARVVEERRILDRLLGGWVALLLVATWGFLAIDPWVLAIVGLTAATGYILMSVLLLRVAARRRRHRGALDPRVRDASLLIVLPLEHDIADLRAVVLSLRSQTYADTRILVAALPGVDVAAADEWLGTDAVLGVPTPPRGVPAFAWARDLALAGSDADLALIVDPATTLAPVAARVLVEHLLATRVDAIGAAPRTALPTLDDRVAGAGPGLWRAAVEPRWWVALSRGRPARVVGPDPAIVLVRVAAFHATQERRGRRAIAPDGVLRAMADDGRRVATAHAGDIASRRADTSVWGMVGWWRVMAPRLAGSTVADLAAMLVVLGVGLLGPLALPLVAWGTGASPPVIVAAAFPLVVLLAARVLLAITQRGSIRAIVWHPATVLVAIGGVLLAIADHVAVRRGDEVTDPRALDGPGDEVVPART